MELRDYLRLLQRRWITIVVVLSACLLGTAAVSVLQPPTYRATTQVLVAQPGTTTTGSVSDNGVATGLAAVVGSFATLAGTPQSVQAATAGAGLPAAAVAISAAGATTNAVMTVAVDAGSPATAQAVANAFPASFPGVLVELDQLGSVDDLTFTVLTAAALPTSTFRPDPVTNTAVGLALGVVLGLVVAVAREALDRRVRDSRGLEDRLRLSVLGVVPNELRRTVLPAVTDPDSRRTEAYRKVRTSLLFGGPDGMASSVTVTSALAGEGKTTLAANLAVVCAQAGQRVALVDADLRKPSVHRTFDLPNEVGLSSVLAGEADLADVVQPHPTGVHVITSGPSPRDPSALLQSPEMRALVTALEAEHDLVLVDTTPALAVSDAAQVSTVCRGAVLVCQLRRTTYDSVRRASTTLERVHAPVLGVVAVGHDEDPDAGYRYYYTAPSGSADGASGAHRTDGAAEAGGWRRPGSR